MAATQEKTTHTPGPWSLETVPTQIGCMHKIGPFPGSCGRKEGFACIYVDGANAYKPQLGKEGELLANARLIAAAPDLLEALQLCRNFGSQGETHDGKSVSFFVEKAIAKATAQ